MEATKELDVKAAYEYLQGCFPECWVSIHSWAQPRDDGSMLLTWGCSVERAVKVRCELCNTKIPAEIVLSVPQV